MIDTLRTEQERVALEAFSITDAQQLFKNFFPTAKAEISSFFNKFSPTTPGIKLNSVQNTFLKKLSLYPYTNIMEVTAFVPEGMHVTYYKYGTVLMEAAVHASRVQAGVLSAYALFLSKLISDTTEKRDTTSFNKAYEELSAERDKLNAALGACFTPGSSKAETTYGRVIDRNTDWTHVFSIADNISKLVNNVDRGVLNKKIAECTQLLDTIMNKMRRGDFEGMSPEVATNLSNGAYQVASELEFFAVTYYKALAFTTSIDKTIDWFNKVMQK